MISVFVDSSVLRESPPGSSAGKKLEELCTLGAVRLHVPELVLREVATGLAADALPETSWRKATARVVAWMPPGADRELLEGAHKTTGILRDSGTKWVEDGLRRWLGQLKAVIASIDGISSASVFEHYFQGTGPFGRAKNREDLPDGFIYLSLRQLSTEGVVYAVIADKRLRSAASGLPNVRVFHSMDALWDDHELQGTARRLRELARPWLIRAVEAAKAFPVPEREMIETIKHRLIHTRVTGPFISDDGEATVAVAENPGPLWLDWDMAVADGRNGLVVPAKVVFEDAVVDLFVHKADFWSLDEDELKAYSLNDGDWNDHYVNASRAEALVVVALLSYQFGLETESGVDRTVAKSVDLEEYLQVEVDRRRDADQARESDP